MNENPITHNDNYIKKPSSYAREEKDEFIYESRIAPGNSSTFNNPIISIKGISACFECQQNDIRYDVERDEIYCYKCGLVLRQGLTDYQPYPKVEIDNVYDKSHYEAIIELLKK